MTSFNLESEFLDLKMSYQHFEYASLSGQGVVGEKGEVGSQEIYEGMTQNTYLFVQEKQTLVKDAENNSLYFIHKHCQPNPHINPQAFSKFPSRRSETGSASSSRSTRNSPPSSTPSSRAWCSPS